jgi:hypothetical protein
MNLRKGMNHTPSNEKNWAKQYIYAGCESDKPRAAEKPDLEIGDTYQGLPIVGMTEELYICRAKAGYTVTFQKKNHRFGLGEKAEYDDNVMLELAN